MTILLDDDKIVDRLMVTMLFPGDSTNVLAPYEIDDVEVVGVASEAIIYDLFSVNAVAGSVDGTDCNPIGLRSAVDDGSDNYISASTLYVVAAGASWTEQSVTFLDDGGDGVDRITGTILEIRFAPKSECEAFIGFNDDSAPNGYSEGDCGITFAFPPFPDTQSLKLVDGGVAAASGYNTVKNTEYILRIEITASGADVYMSGGAFGTIGSSYTKIGSTTATSDPIYPCIEVRLSGTIEVYSVFVYQ